jgi:hypothetical protein
MGRCSVIATEQESGLPFLRTNVDANRCLFPAAGQPEAATGSCTVERLAWGELDDITTLRRLVHKLAAPRRKALPRAVRASQRGILS